MKHIFKLMLLIMALVIAPMTAQADKTAKTDPNVERYNVSDNNGLLAFGKSYYEVDGRPVGANGNYYSTEHANWSMKSWPNADTNKHVTTYIHFPACSTNAKIQLTTTGAVTFVVKVYCMEDPSTVLSSKTVNISTGTDQWITVMDTKTFSQKAWYKFDIQCTSGAANVGEFKYWQFSNSLSEPAYTADYMSSPSVHLNGWHTTDPTVPSAGRYDWTYQEVMIPEGDDIVGTYCMSLGVLHGYMGIQKDSENDYPIIFSMWDNGSTDNDPNLPDYLRSGALDAGEGVTIARFGGEGTGAQAKFRTSKNWEPGKWVKFLCNARPEIVDVEVDDPDHPGQKKTITYSNTLTSAWVWADGIDTDWRYIATIRQSGANNYMDGWYSFLEDYNWPSGQWKRNAYYRRGGLHSMVTGKWYNANNVGFGHTDGGNTYGDRDDYGHGKTIVDGEEAFYLTSGGYHENVTDTENTLTLITDFENKIGTPISQATLTTLLARVDQAIKKEQGTKLAEDFENSRETLAASGFTVVNVNSEATNEGDANKKEAAIDGDESTYWHSRWSGGTGNYNYPFYIDIQLSEEMQAKEIEQIAFVFRTGNKSYVPKKLQLQYSANNSSWTPYSEVYNIENVATSTVNLTTKVTGKKYLRLYFAEGYSDCLAIKEIYFRTAVGRDALNAQVQAILDKENRFDGYSTSDLAALNTAYNNGNWTDAQTIKTALTNLAANGTLLKYGVVNGTNAISSFKAYQLYNAKGLGDLVVENNAPAVKADADVNVTLDANNWQLLRSEKWNAYYLYNASAEKYLAFENSTAVLTDKPTPVYVGTRSSGGNFEGFTFQFDLANANSFLTANGTSATLGASNTNGAVWQLRDNYGITPAAVNVNELLAEADEEGAPEGFDGEGYTIRLNGTNLYLSTIEVDDKGKSTYSLSTYPEYFKVVSTGNKTYTLQSATTKKYVGYTGAPTSWDVVNHADNWTIADIEGGVTTIIKSGSQGLGANSNEQAAGRGVYTNKTDTHQWIFTYFEGSGEEPEDDGLIKMSTGDTKYYYSIRNFNNSSNYAHYDSNSNYLQLNSTKNPNAVFYFTAAAGGNDTYQAVNVHNFTTDGTMNGWNSWGTGTAKTWYISQATQANGTTFNISEAANKNSCWNHQAPNVKSYGADNGSAWYIEEVPTTELTVAVHGLTGQGGVAYNGTTYTDGQQFTAFFENPTIEAASVDGYSATVTVYKGVANVDYTADDPFFYSANNQVYHKIIFNANKNYGISDATSPSNFFQITEKASATNWAFIGNINSFKLRSANGKYVGVAHGTPAAGSESDFIAEVNEADATTFKMVDLGNDIFAIVRTSDTGNGFNAWANIAAGHNIGFYGTGDGNSKLVFYGEDGTTVQKPTFPSTEYDIEGATSFTAPSKNTLWYTEAPGTNYNNWMEYSLPIGNGDFGGSVYGAVMNDKITVNEKSLWDGKSETNYSYAGYVKMGNVWVKNLSNAFENGVKNYVRYLDIDNAVAGVKFSDAQGTQYERTYIASEPNKVMAVRYTATGTNKLNLQFTYEPGGQLTSSSVSGQKPTTEYAVSGRVGTAKFNGKLPIVSYASQMTVKATDGTVTEDYKGITVSNATEVIVYLAGGTDFTAAHPATSFVDGTASQLPGIMASRISTASATSWESLRSTHESNFQSYMGRVAIDLKKNGVSVSSNKNTKALVDYYNASADNKNTADGIYLEQLYYNYGRYLLISSNRNTSVPNNLQGLWNDTDSGNAPWHSDIHTNINIQMNYWPAEPNNLSDLHKPLLDHIKMLADAPGPKNQAKTKGSNVGWVINTESNLFGGMSDFKSNYTIANAWYVTHLWQHYRYTLDTEFLKSAFPAMLGAAKYWSQRLVQGTDGSYECPSEWSPEQGPDENATAHSQQLVRELFDNTIAAANAINAVSLGLISQTELNDLTTKRAGLDLGLRTEEYQHSFVGSDGKQKNWNTLIADGTAILKEWKTSSYKVGENQHRHTSHLMALYPFSQLTQDVTADGTTYTAQQLFDAAKASLTQRGDNSTGWAMGWRVNLWARALDGNHARTLINNALKHARSYGTDQSAGGVYYNLWDGHAPFQIDGNFGVCAGVSEMLLQSHTGVIQLLPALPDAWAEGSITGLKAVGNFTVSQQWAGGALTKATITSHKGQELIVKYKDVDLSGVNVTVNGTSVTPVSVTGGYKIANVNEGDEVVILLTEEPEPEKVYTYTIRNKQNGKYAYYDASTVNEGNTIVALTGEQANAGEFTLTPVNDREDYYIMSCNSKYVKALNFNDANYNIAFVDNESDATAMHVAYVTTAGNVDYYNIIPDGGSRSWNARNPINNITTVGQWNAGNNDGSLWQFTSTSTEEITLTYNFTTEGLNDATRSITLHKGDFRPRSLTAAPYGVTVTSTLKTGGIMTANDTETVAYTIADDYPFNYSNDFSSAHWYNLKIGNNLNVGYTTTQSDYNYPTSGSTEPANFAFLGTPWGTKIICKEAGADYGVGGTMENNASLTSVAIADAVTYIFERNSGHNVFHLDGVENGYINTVSWQSRLGNWINGAAKTDGNSTFQFIATEVDPSELCAELQEKIDAIYDFFTGVIGQVGYPAYDSETAETLAAYADIFEGEVTEDNYAQALEAYNALLNETNIALPENGKAYKLMAVHVEEDGSIKNAYTIYSTADGQITGKNEEADGEIGDEGYTRFIVRRVGEGNEFILVNELGRYLCWFDTGDSGKSFTTKGATEAYDETYSIITLEHATTDCTNNNGSVKALTAEQRFGLFQMKAHPKNATTQYQYFCYDDGNSHRFVSGNNGDKYYNANGRHTFLFQLVEDESYTYNRPTLIKGNDGHYYASIYLPYPMQVSSEVECYRGTEDRGGSLALEQVNKDDNAPVPAGGYVLYSEQVFTDSDEYSETFGEVLEKVSQLVIPATANPAAVDNLFTGSTVNGDAGKLWEDELEGNNPYVLANKSKGIGFYRYTATSYPKGKAIYLAGGASTRERIGFQFDDIVEAIKAAKGEETDNTVFDLTGRRLEKAAKGVNIMGGKKVLK
ncbi:MAG: glycoside hydrolase N-terminal domain-containing protein [Bacteroidaceae bacterium]|nr:glycoside hydrolase N-terminal domain-containing protein [Bacteroidaceae bacterium]